MYSPSEHRCKKLAEAKAFAAALKACNSPCIRLESITVDRFTVRFDFDQEKATAATYVTLQRLVREVAEATR